jgi:uncharacterized protein (TIGR02452 family)
MFHKDTRRSDKFKPTDKHFTKTGKENPKRLNHINEAKFEGYTKFLESTEYIGNIDIREHITRMKTYTHFYKYPNKYYSVPLMNLEMLSLSDKDIKTQISYEKDYTINVAYKYKKDNPTKNVCILNFASAKNPGGGFMRGSMAQEESIAYVSTLYHSLIQSDMYEINKKNPQNGLYNDIGIYTNEICIFKLHRDDTAYIEPVYPSVISCPAINKLHAIQKGISEEHIYNKMIDRIKLIFEIAKSHSVDILILGAYGCGVFGNNPKDIKEIFSGLLENNYENIFENIIFAIPDDDKFKIFIDVR